MKLITWIINLFKKLKRRWVLAKAYPKMKKAYEKQLIDRKLLRSEINVFLRDYFGMDANSKYIPKDHKNKDEVRVAVCDRFGEDMFKLNLKFKDLFSI